MAVLESCHQIIRCLQTRAEQSGVGCCSELTLQPWQAVSFNMMLQMNVRIRTTTHYVAEIFILIKDRGQVTTYQVLLLRCLQCSCNAAACCQSYVCCIMATATQYGCKALLLSWLCKTKTAQQHTCDSCEQHHVMLLVKIF